MWRFLTLVSALAFAASVLAFPVFAQSEATAQTLDDCKLIPDDAARLSCFDRVMKAGRGNVAGTGADLSPVPIPQSPATNKPGPGVAVNNGPQSAPPMTAEQRREAEKQNFGLPTSAQPGAAERNRDKIKKLTTKIANVEVVGANQLRVTTTDGQVWDQTEGNIEPARVGDTFTIRAGILGSKLCRAGSSAPYRCVRADRPSTEAAADVGDTTADAVTPASQAAAPAPQASAEAPAGGVGGAGAGGAGSRSVAAGGPGTSASGGEASPPMSAEEERAAKQKAFGLPGYTQPDYGEKKSAEIKKIATSVASLSVTGLNRLRVTTTGGGEIWDQTEGTAPLAHVGDAFTVRSGWMGAKICKVGNAPAFRCVRIDRPDHG